MQYGRSAVRLLLPLLPALGLASCAGVDRADSRRPHESTGFVVDSSGWLAGSTDVVERREELPCARPSAGMTPDGPWIGTIGLRSQLRGAYEYGFGVCLPNPYGSPVGQATGADPLRSAAVGVWLKFDF